MSERRIDKLARAIGMLIRTEEKSLGIKSQPFNVEIDDREDARKSIAIGRKRILIPADILLNPSLDLESIARKLVRRRADFRIRDEQAHLDNEKNRLVSRLSERIIHDIEIERSLAFQLFVRKPEILKYAGEFGIPPGESEGENESP